MSSLNNEYTTLLKRLFHRQNHQEAQLANEALGIGRWEYDVYTDTLDVSEYCYALLGMKNGQDIHLALVKQYIHPNDYDRLEGLFRRSMDEGVGFITRVKIIPRDQQAPIDVKMQAEAVFKDGNLHKLKGVVYDQTNQDALEMQLMQSENAYQQMFDHLNAGIWIGKTLWDETIYLSKQMEEILELSLKPISRGLKSWRSAMAPEDRKLLEEKVEVLQEGEVVEHTYPLKMNNGSEKWIFEQVIPKTSFSGKVNHLFGIVLDVTSEAGAKQELGSLTKYDQLTGLPNYYTLTNKIEAMIVNHQLETFALCFVRLDNFSWIVNHAGIKSGKLVLRDIAGRLQAFCPEPYHLSRVGPYSFGLIIPHVTNREAVEDVMQNVHAIIREPVTVGHETYYVTASIGISLYPEQAKTGSVLQEKSRIALESAVFIGKNNHQFYHTDKHHLSHNQLYLEKELRKAVQEESFDIYFQAQVNPVTGTIQGAEAMVYWNHEQFGLLTQEEVLPLTEELHLFQEVGNWRIREVFKQLATWKKAGKKLVPIAIDLSSLRFLDRGLIDTFKREFATYDIPPQYIVLEITESYLLAHGENVAAILKELKALGVQLALDEFGTGYSAFYHLQHIEFDSLKIGRMFMKQLDHEHEKTMTIVYSLLHLAKGLGMQVVAAGVEDYEQLEYLVQQECDAVQGFIYSEPVPLDQFEALMKQRYLTPQTRKRMYQPVKEQRNDVRFSFPYPLRAKMNMTDNNDQTVEHGSVPILIENISLEGLRFLTGMQLPMTSNYKLEYHFELMREHFSMEGALVRKELVRKGIYAYEVTFQSMGGKKDKLASLIHSMTHLKNHHQSIPDTPLIQEKPYAFLRGEFP